MNYEMKEAEFLQYCSEEIVKCTHCDTNVALKLAYNLIQDFKEEIPEFNTVINDDLHKTKEKLDKVVELYNDYSKVMYEEIDLE